MAKQDAAASGPFDLEKLKALIEMMEEHGVTEVSLRRGEEHWRLRRGPQEGAQLMAPGGYVPVPAPSASPSPPPAASAEPETKPAEEEEAVYIKSPTVGTFYSSPSPDDPPFVEVGSEVEPDTIVCIVEAMKVFNQIPAEVSGTIAEILVKNGDPVEYGQPLFRVRPKK
ncbi:MAG: acetyl-CoA carboxylase biotin carboxyl carrier protein [Planctomycetes bacterium]|nr:acetyl-CoA carboxylase biotin carboxyl carrier protein [Planctomycetota bacterium]